MKMFEIEVEVGDRLEIGGLSVFPLTSVEKDGPAFLTGPGAGDAGSLPIVAATLPGPVKAVPTGDLRSALTGPFLLADGFFSR